MIFEIDEIPEMGLSSEFFVKKERLEIDHSDCSLIENVKVNGKFRRVGEDVYFSGEIGTLLKVACTRCLKSFSLPVRNNIRIHFVPRMEEFSAGCEVEVKEEDVEKEVYIEGRIDLSNSLRDQILLDVPFIILCGEDCKGICLVCGNDLNLNQCKCQDDTKIDPRFAVLKNLKDKLK